MPRHLQQRLHGLDASWLEHDMIDAWAVGQRQTAHSYFLGWMFVHTTIPHVLHLAEVVSDPTTLSEPIACWPGWTVEWLVCHGENHGEGCALPSLRVVTSIGLAWYELFVRGVCCANTGVAKPTCTINTTGHMCGIRLVYAATMDSALAGSEPTVICCFPLLSGTWTRLIVCRRYTAADAFFAVYYIVGR
jgi:hypothetical protein